MIKKIFWGIAVTLAIITGTFPFVFYFSDIEFGIVSFKDGALLANMFWRFAFHTHIIFAAISLLIGWLQFVPKFRIKYPAIHRNLGKTYVISSLLSAVAGMYMGVFATSGIIAAAGFICMGFIWFYTTLSGYLHIRKLNMPGHRKMMIYSYATCFAGVTLRIELPVLVIIFGDFELAYRFIAWVCWIPNLMFAFRINKKIKRA
ncbi:MAG: DUF2306 domain-containing protein, partial [Chitinophagaceae bacterium]